MEKKQNNQEPAIEKDPLPLGVLLDRASEDMCSMIFNYMGQNGIPPSLFDYVLTTVVAKIKEMKVSEYAGKIGGTDNGEHNGTVE